MPPPRVRARNSAHSWSQLHERTLEKSAALVVRGTAKKTSADPTKSLRAAQESTPPGARRGLPNTGSATLMITAQTTLS